ncbi:MAG: DUF2029 domain-containing protein [Deltaproteobacteria bacterium]|nr:DUF2029 domain-containing protein [Deltaproteobacteria bacterium]
MNDYLFFIEPAREVYKGTLHIYSHRLFPHLAPPLGLGYDYPPLYAIIMSPFVAIGDYYNLPDASIGQYIFPIPLLIFDVFCLLSLVRLLRLLRPDLSTQTLLLCLVLAIAIPGFVSSSIYFSHIESLLSAFLLTGLYYYLKKDWIRSGLCLSLCLLTKQTGLFAVVPLFMVSIKVMFEQRTYSQILKLLGASFIPFFLLFLPFVCADFENAIYNLVEAHRLIDVYGENVWHVVNEILKKLSSEYYENIMFWIRSYAQSILMGVMLLTTSALVFTDRIRSQGDLLGLLVISTLLVQVFSKYTSFIYKIVPFTLLIAWDVFRSEKGIPIVAITFIALFSILDSLPMGVHTRGCDTTAHLFRSLVRIPLNIGLIVYVFKSILDNSVKGKDSKGNFNRPKNIGVI